MSDALGAIYTPSDVADLLASWAIRSPSDQILDLGIGEGAFVFAAHRKLVDLGTEPVQAAAQIYGAEVNKATFGELTERASALDLRFPHLVCQDFFQSSFPQVDIVIGNPPYVRRRVFPSQTIEQIRKNVLDSNPTIASEELSQLTDLYVYFLLHASKSLKLGGRLAVIVSDSWLNTRYGRVLKRYLTNNYVIERIVSFDRPIFLNAQIKAILLFAKKEAPSNGLSQIAFTRVMNGLPVNALSPLFQQPEPTIADVTTLLVPPERLAHDKPWGIHFKISQVNKQIANSDWFTPIKNIAQTRIGLQTLAKEFFTFPAGRVQDNSIERQYLQPMAHSVSQFDTPVIDENVEPPLYVFYCSEPREHLLGTKALEHIQSGETKVVKVRGRNEIVIGYNNKERIKKARRPNWYDIKTDVERRGCAPILIPRLIYHRYMVLWNKSRYVPGDAVIELFPSVELQSPERDEQLFLAILNSTLMEVLIRGYSQLYGGGTYTVGLAQIKQLPMPNVARLDTEQQDSLINAYQTFLASGKRNSIDKAIWSILGLNEDLFNEAVDDLRLMALTAKKSE